MATLAEIQGKVPGALTLAAAKDILPAIWTIKGVTQKTFGQGATAESVMALEFVESSKYLTLNKSRVGMLADVVRADDELVGKKVSLMVGTYDVPRKGPCQMVIIQAVD